MYVISGYRGRAHLPKIIQERGLTNPIVEVGVHRGAYAAILLKYKNDYWGVDPWDTVDESFDQEQRQLLEPGANCTPEEEARRVLSASRKRNAILLKSTSESASLAFADSSVSFVYIDANHRYEHVLRDLRIWWPKVEYNGVLAGHDIICSWEDRVNWGKEIQPAVEQFATEIRQSISLVPEEGLYPWSFFFTKV